MSAIKQQSNDEWRNRRSREQIALGGLPLNAEWRLRRLTEGRHLFSSFFSVNELALMTSLGIRPLGQVLGCSGYHVGVRPQPCSESRELTDLSQAQNRVRRLALSRLQREAQTLGARAVVGVRLETHPAAGGTALLEVTASGTAVDWHEARPPLVPMLCGLSGQDFCALRQGGYRPVGLALGTCVYYQIGSANTTWALGNPLMSGTARTNQELTDYTHGFGRARFLAACRLQEEAASVRADCVVGLSIDRTLETREVELELNERKTKRRDLIVSMVLLGTAIAPFTDHTPTIYPVMPLGT